MRYVIKSDLDCGYGNKSDYIEDTTTGEAVVIFDPSEGEYVEGCPSEYQALVLHALNAFNGGD